MGMTRLARSKCGQSVKFKLRPPGRADCLDEAPAPLHWGMEGAWLAEVTVGTQRTRQVDSEDAQERQMLGAGPRHTSALGFVLQSAVAVSPFGLSASSPSRSIR